MFSGRRTIILAAFVELVCPCQDGVHDHALGPDRRCASGLPSHIVFTIEDGNGRAALLHEPRGANVNRMLVVIALLGASPVDSEIDLILDRSQWETLKVLDAPGADQRP